MTEYRIKGGKKLRGSVRVQGSKNSALPLLAAALLVPGEVELQNCPDLLDVDCALEILVHLGCRVSRSGHTVTVDSAGMDGCDIPASLTKRMRSSVIFTGAILARAGQAELHLPGGCMLGPRPINYHIDALRALGAKAELSGDRLICRAGRLRGCDVLLPFPSVGATENAMLAAAGCREPVCILNAACEPEIADLAGFLRAVGISVTGAGTPVIRVEGGRTAHTARYTVMPDRIAAGTYLCAAAVTGGTVELTNTEPDHLTVVLESLCRTGCGIGISGRTLRLTAPDRIDAPGIIETGPYPGYPTDMQPPLLALSCTAAGTSVFIENMFESRYNHIDGLRRMGADIRSAGRFAAVSGVSELTGAVVTARDLRAGAALVTAALGASGETVICRMEHLERGYERMDAVLGELGADVVRMTR